MNTGLTIIPPIALTDAMLLATDVPETDYAAWAVGTTYAAGVRVIDNHFIYESRQAANVGKTPAAQPLWWGKVGATNRWRAFDLSNTSQTAQAANFYYEIRPLQAVNSLAVLNITSANSLRVRLTDATFGVVYDQTIALASIPSQADWYAWFFEPRTSLNQFVATDMPSYPNAVLRLDFMGSSSLAVGVILFGQQKTIGLGVRLGARVGIQDYSRKEKTEFGETTLVQRAFAKKTNFAIAVENMQLDNTVNLLTSLRATPCFWIASPSFDSLQVFGFYKDFDLSISYPAFSDCTLDIEGLT